MNDQGLDVSVFVPFVSKVWPGDYDKEKMQSALPKALDINAYGNNALVGYLWILSDGYLFDTTTELLVLPEYQKRGIGSKLLQLARDNTPAMLYFGAQPGVEPFYERNSCQRSLRSYIIKDTK